MIIVTVHHWCKEGMFEAACRRIDGNGDAMAAMDGFVFRYRMSSPDDPGKLSTVTGWQDESHYQKWIAHKRELDRGQAAPSVYARYENELFQVERAHDARVAP